MALGNIRQTGNEILKEDDVGIHVGQEFRVGLFLGRQEYHIHEGRSMLVGFHNRQYAEDRTPGRLLRFPFRCRKGMI